MNEKPLLILTESTPPTMSEYLSIKMMLKNNVNIVIGIPNTNSTMNVNKKIEMWFFAFSEYPTRIKRMVIPKDYKTNTVFIRELKKRFKRVAVKDKLTFVAFATKGYETLMLPYVPGYETLFLTNAYKQSVAFRFLENYGK